MNHPDLYGHYREAKFTQTKHHWWWKANRVFEQLEVTRNHTGEQCSECVLLFIYVFFLGGRGSGMQNA